MATQQQIQLFQLLTVLALRKQVKHRHYLTRPDLTDSKQSAWTKLYSQKNDDTFIHVMGLDVASFEHLVRAIDRHLQRRQNRVAAAANNNHSNNADERHIDGNNIENKYAEDSGSCGATRRERNSLHRNNNPYPPLSVQSKNKGGRPSSLDNKANLALLLYHLHSKTAQKELCQIFGIVEHTCSTTISRMLPLLLEVLIREPDARIQWPTASECKEFAEQIAALNPDLPDPVFGFMDGVFFPNDNHPDPTIQNAYYNGWKSSTSVTNALVFTPDGCICWAAINRPGSWHDAKVVLPLYRLLKNDTPAGFKLIADAAFQAEPNHILTPFKKGQFSSDLTIAYLQLEQHYNVVSARQPAEWGMRSVQADFPRLKLPLAASNFEYNRVLIACCFRLYNYRTRRLRDLNQIKTVFSSDYLAPFV